RRREGYRPYPRAGQHGVEELRLDYTVGHGAERSRMRRPRRLQQEQHDPSGEELLERLGLAPLDGRDELGQRHDVEALWKRRAGEADQGLPVAIDADPGRIALRERGSQREAERRYASVAQSYEQRHAPDDAVGVGLS